MAAIAPDAAVAAAQVGAVARPAVLGATIRGAAMQLGELVAVGVMGRAAAEDREQDEGEDEAEDRDEGAHGRRSCSAGASANPATPRGASAPMAASRTPTAARRTPASDRRPANGVHRGP
jgi:hypothetical protein